MIQGMQDDGKDDEDSEDESIDNSRTKKGKRSKGKGKGKDVHWSGHQCVVLSKNTKETFNQREIISSTTPKDLENKLMLDTGSTIRVTVKNRNFLTNIRISVNPIIMATNTGCKRMGNDGDLAGVGIAKFDPEQLANILGFAHMSDKYRICLLYTSPSPRDRG